MAGLASTSTSMPSSSSSPPPSSSRDTSPKKVRRQPSALAFWQSRTGVSATDAKDNGSSSAAVASTSGSLPPPPSAHDAHTSINSSAPRRPQGSNGLATSSAAGSSSSPIRDESTDGLDATPKQPQTTRKQRLVMDLKRRRKKQAQGGDATSPARSASASEDGHESQEEGDSADAAAEAEARMGQLMEGLGLQDQAPPVAPPSTTVHHRQSRSVQESPRHHRGTANAASSLSYDSGARARSSSETVSGDSFFDAVDMEDDPLDLELPAGAHRAPLSRTAVTASSSTLRQQSRESAAADEAPPPASKDSSYMKSFLPSPPSKAADAPRNDAPRAVHLGRRRQSLHLPPVRPLPEGPLPPTPPPKGDEDAVSPSTSRSASFNAETSASSGASPQQKAAQQPPSPVPAPAAAAPPPSSLALPATTLGPNGTIRGRPRGATVGAVPSSSPRTSSLLGRLSNTPRPRSLLSHELILPGAAGQADMASSTSSPADLHSNQAAASSSAGGDSSASRRTSYSAGVESSMTSLSVPAMESEQRGGEAEERRPSAGRSRSGSTASVLLQQVQYPPRSQASFVIAVVGHRGAGKSTVIKKGLRQFGLSRPQVLSEKVTSHYTVCIVDHEQRTIEVLEVDTSVLISGSSKRFAWPRFLPNIDAVILCYDASQLASFRGMSELLENFHISKVSIVMLACKSDIEPKGIDPFYASDMAGVYNVGLAECTMNSEEGKKRMRDCFSYLVKEVAKARVGKGKRTDRERIGGIAATQLASPQPSQGSLILDGSPRLPSQPATVASPQPESSTPTPPLPALPPTTTVRQASDSTTRSDATGTDDDAVQQSINRAQLGLQSAKSAGGYVTLEELWDKLFFAAVTGTDERFLLMFMVFYRGFVRPIELLRQMISRFDSLAQREQKDSLIRYSLLRLAAMLGDWMQDYPGDLSGPETLPLLCDFFERLCVHPMTTHIARDLRPLLDVVKTAPDLDAIWSKDQDSSKPKSVAADVPPMKPHISPLQPDVRDRSGSDASSSYPSSRGSAPADARLAANRDRSDSDATAATTNSGSDVPTSSASNSSLASAGGGGGNTSSSSATATPGTPHIPDRHDPLNHPLPPAPSQSQPQKRLAALRAASTALLDTPDAAIAAELTRVEWQVFMTVRPRDLLRHILVARELRDPEAPVAKSIVHFNYVSYWVCSMILVQQRSKLRAKLIDKFMNIASILRHDNNYNTLQAVLAGLGNSAIHRLKNSPLNHSAELAKPFASLQKLMAMGSSFRSYRMALENSEGRTIPYLGVHMQDILSMSDGNPSKRASDGMIHWRKFSLMDEAVMAVVHCQQWSQRPLPANPATARLIWGLPVMDDDECYDRSMEVEPRAEKNGGTSGSASTGGGSGGIGGNSNGSGHGSGGGTWSESSSGGGVAASLSAALPGSKYISRVF